MAKKLCNWVDSSIVFLQEVIEDIEKMKLDEKNKEDKEIIGIRTSLYLLQQRFKNFNEYFFQGDFNKAVKEAEGLNWHLNQVDRHYTNWSFFMVKGRGMKILKITQESGTLLKNLNEINNLLTG